MPNSYTVTDGLKVNDSNLVKLFPYALLKLISQDKRDIDTIVSTCFNHFPCVVIHLFYQNSSFYDIHEKYPILINL